MFVALIVRDGAFEATFFFVCFLLVRPFGDSFVFDPIEFFRFGDGPAVAAVVNFLFVPPGVVTAGGKAAFCGGDITRSGERLVDETTLVAFTEASLDGCTAGAMPAAGADWLFAF